MNTTTTISTTLSLVRQLLEKSLNFRVELNPEETQKLVETMPIYNRMTSKGMSQLIKNINKRMPRMDYGPTNPNTGHTFHTFHVGNENSLVIYVELIGYYIEKLTPQERQKLCLDIKSYSEKAGADEFHITEGDFGKLTFRLWWD
jgi:hypothetical protein